ncbi:Endoribonuclease L-PSP/chorismate mutase-like protein, partial [Ochromonadaceae sp. CCMP2298]
MSSIVRMDTVTRMSRVVKHAGTIYLAGQVAEDPSLDITAQTISALANVDALLVQAGSSREHILSTTIYLRNIDTDFKAMNQIWDEWVPRG